MEIDPQALENCLQTAKLAGSPPDQVQRFLEVGYIPLPWQWEFHAAAREADLDNGPVDIGAGGARGPGKSHAELSQAGLDDCQRVDNLKGLFLRQTGIAAKESFDDLIEKTLAGKVPFERTGSLLRFKNNSRIVLGGFKDERDIDKYIGIEYDFIIIEELNQLTAEKYEKLRGSLRTSKQNWRPRMYTSFNPGGIGHTFVKGRYINPKREGNQKETRFIGSTYKSNPYLNKEYIEYLEGLTGDLGLAWREGEWELFAGQVFHEWRYSKHVVPKFSPDGDLPIYLSMDWGYSEKSAFAAYAHVVKKEKIDGENFNRVVTFKEWYGNQKSPEAWAEIIMHYMKSNGITFEKGYTDPAMHNTQTDGSTSIAGIMTKFWKDHNFKCPLIRANNNRIARVATVHNWLSDGPDNVPYWIQTEDCSNLNRTLPELVHDETKVDDVDTDQEDHAYDSVGYYLPYVKFISVKPGSYSAKASEKKKYLPTDERGLPVINPKDFFGSQS